MNTTSRFGKPKTWTYAAPSADAPWELAGPVGPVRLHVGKEVDLPIP
jgi:hypothetical protein